VPCSAAKTSTQNTFRLRKQAAILKRWKMWCACRRCSAERLQDADVEHVMDASPSRELELVRYCANAFQDLVWPGVSWTQLPAAAWQECLCWPVKNAKPYPVAHLELQVSVVSIIVVASVLLSLL